jgi:hypothetical protein
LQLLALLLSGAPVEPLGMFYSVVDRYGSINFHIICEAPIPFEILHNLGKTAAREKAARFWGAPSIALQQIRAATKQTANEQQTTSK